jgi:hypothetical protein
MPFIDFNPQFKFLKPELLQHPMIPRPLHGVAPREIKGREWWDTVRNTAYATNNFCCWACGDREFLNAHEVYDVNYALGRTTFMEVVALCEACHHFIHIGLYGTFLLRGSVGVQEFKRVVKSRYQILKKAHLKANWGFYQVVGGLIRTYSIQDTKWLQDILKDKVPPPIVDDVPWGKWRMVFEGVEYPPKFLSEYDSRKHYGSEE